MFFVNSSRSVSSYKNLFFHNINLSELSLDDLKLFAESLSLDDLKPIAKSRGIKGYKSMSKERLLSSLIKPKIDNERLKNIIEDLNKLRHKFSKLKIKEIRENIYETESNKIFQHKK